IVGAMADDYGDAGRLQGGRCPEDAFDDGQAGDSVQDLGQLGFHPRALAGGQDDDVNVTHAQDPNLDSSPDVENSAWHRIRSFRSLNLFIALDDVVDLLG